MTAKSFSVRAARRRHYSSIIKHAPKLTVVEIERKYLGKIKVAEGNINALPPALREQCFSVMEKRLATLRKLRHDIKTLIPSQIGEYEKKKRSSYQAMARRAKELSEKGAIKGGRRTIEKKIAKLQKNITSFEGQIEKLNAQLEKKRGVLRIANKRTHLIFSIGGVPVAFKIEDVIKKNHKQKNGKIL